MFWTTGLLWDELERVHLPPQKDRIEVSARALGDYLTQVVAVSKRTDGIRIPVRFLVSGRRFIPS